MADGVSEDAQRVLRALKTNRCVLIKGVPASGKSRLLAELRRIFETFEEGAQSKPGETVAIALGSEVPPEFMPSPECDNRKTWSLVMNQNSRYREFWRAQEASVDPARAYQISSGALYLANEYAKEPKSTALVTIDELNRGPAVNVFGPSIVAIEADKRAGPDNKPTAETATFELPGDDGIYGDYWLSPHLYLVCAQNNADTSVEAIDTAFLRRFAPIELLPREDVLLEHFGLASVDDDIPEAPGNATDVYRALVRAWRNVNRKLAIGASPDFQLGHGALMNPNEDVPSALPDALDYAGRGWARVNQHLGEVFYGKADHIAEALWVAEGGSDHPYKLVSVPFADLDQVQLERDDSDLYRLLRAIALSA